ncbi:DUF2157 domain-containing protein [Hymenobacter latericus]|uniref:DUF2157 domain-containing protein n=1 Tax=Hymenobacter sp. YIM 151858-1 TaxID=2987688 RepID=UPI00222654F7|nr:DUF2157 domain-containing protein [Hymenobacter sp. YIM 151858-1]UYZ59699.1 DUF2157 domain-containing protein [Hymenobacter sp. YIM 151858-1]
MDPNILASLQQRQIIAPEHARALAEHERTRPFSLYFELRALLSLGVTLLSTGLGIYLYQNLDSISHAVIVAGIALVSAAGFGYAYWRRQPFTWAEAPRASVFADYALLLGCLTFLTLEGYLQAQYGVFGARYGWLPLLPALLFFGCAYRFDHRGVLAMGITALAAWVGLAAAPADVFRQNDFSAPYLDVVAVLLGLALVAAGVASERYQRKPHFAYTYVLMGSNLALLAALTSLFRSSYETAHLPAALGVVLLLAFSAGLWWYGRRSHSYLFVLLAALYGYVAVTYVFIELITAIDSSLISALAFYCAMLYFPASAAGVIWLLKNIKKIVRGHESEGL